MTALAITLHAQRPILRDIATPRKDAEWPKNLHNLGHTPQGEG